jgi:hypothetical protein
LGLRGVNAQKVKISEAIRITQKNIASVVTAMRDAKLQEHITAVVAAMCDVMGEADCYCACQSCHDSKIQERRRICQE